MQKVLFRLKKSVMIEGWKKRGDYWMNIGSLDFVREPAYRGYLGTRERGSSNLSGGKKNSMWLLWYGSPETLRQEDTLGTRFILRQCSDLSGCGGSASMLPKVPESEAGEIGLACQQSLLYKTVCLLCRAEVPYDDSPGCSEGTKAGLAHSEDSGQGVHGGTTSP